MSQELSPSTGTTQSYAHKTNGQAEVTPNACSVFSVCSLIFHVTETPFIYFPSHFYSGLIAVFSFANLFFFFSGLIKFHAQKTARKTFLHIQVLFSSAQTQFLIHKNCHVKVH